MTSMSSAVVFGAIRYSLGGGNTSTQHDATDQITQALLGLLLLFGAYLILSTIDTNLPKQLGLPPLDVIEALPPPAAPVGCRGGQCFPIQPGQGVTCKSSASCSADLRVITLLGCVTQRRDQLSIVITEAMPPTIPHIDPGHYNGCAIDLTVSPFSCANVANLEQILNQCGFFGVLNEYTGCGGRVPSGSESTGGHFHVDGC